MMTTITHEIGEINIDLNPYHLGEIFAKMDSQEQMRFLNGFAGTINEKWPFQCSYIASEYNMYETPITKSKVINALEDLLEHLKEKPE